MTFDEWLDEIENYSARWERLRCDIPDVDSVVLIQWLRAAYDVGYDEGYNEAERAAGYTPSGKPLD
jgi:hypothetical protein